MRNIISNKLLVFVACLDPEEFINDNDEQQIFFSLHVNQRLNQKTSAAQFPNCEKCKISNKPCFDQTLDSSQNILIDGMLHVLVGNTVKS